MKALYKFNCGIVVSLFLLFALPTQGYGAIQVSDAAALQSVNEGYDLAKRLDKKLLDRMADNVELNSVASSMTTDGKIIEFVEEDGMRIKYLRNPDAPKLTWKQLVKSRSLPKVTGTEDDPNNILFESFEDAPEYDQTWYPDGWYQFSLVGNTFRPEDGSTTKIWRLSQGSICGVPDGQYVMWVNQEMEAGFDSRHDEWLVSEPFTPDQYSRVFFNYWYCPIFMLDNAADRNPLSTLKLNVSLDDGKTWEEVWDIIDVVKNMTTQELYTGNGVYNMAVWHSYQVDISKYAGNSIRLAFQVVSITESSQSVALDRIIVRGPNPEAAYIIPNGFFRWGYGEELLFPAVNSAPITAALAPAYAESTWQNASNDECHTYEWLFDNPDGSGSTISMTDEEPSLSYPYCQTQFPTLTATNEIPIFTNTYQAAPPTSGLIQYGGEALFNDLRLGVGTFDINKGYGAGLVSTESDSCFLFGNGSRDNWQAYKLKAIANMFDAPSRPYLLKNVWIKALNVACSDDAELQMTICRVDQYDNVYTSNPLATATCRGSQIEEIQDDGRFKYYNIPFKIEIYDEDLGLYVEEPLVVSDKILITIRGFDDINAFPSIGFSYQYNAHDYGENHAYAYVKPRNQPEEFYALPDLFGEQMATSFIMSLDAVYPFMRLESGSTTLAFGKGGGTTSIDVNYYGPYGNFNEDCYIAELPEWAEIGESSNSGTLHTLDITVDPLPDGTTTRNGNITIETYGNDPLTLTLTQDVNTGIATVSGSSGIKVSRQGEDFVFNSLPGGIARVEVVSLSGQVISRDAVDGDSAYTLRGSNLDKGIYFVRFGGDTTETVKIIK